MHVITGGAGFIGSNFAAKLLARGEEVVVLDSLRRKGSEENLKWLKGMGGGKLVFERLDVARDVEALQKAVGECDRVYHLAAQVAVTESVADPRGDFEINALGSLNVCEAVRKAATSPHLTYASTNKVYGGLEGIKTKEEERRYSLLEPKNGVSEETCVDFHSPYGCSKGCADQYVRDYHRIYGVDTTVFRQSCIYGPNQFGIEDQGWLAWFLIASKLGRKLTIYGDGKQVRDVLYVDDLFDAYDKAYEKRGVSSGKIYNIGGGLEQSISLLEYLGILAGLGVEPEYGFGDWRPGDQKIYVSDIRKAGRELGWAPKTDKLEGIKRMKAWIDANMGAISERTR